LRGKEFKKLIFQLFNIEAYLYRTGNKIIVYVYRKAVYKFIKEYLKWDEIKGQTVRLKDNLTNYSNNFLKGFVRGLFDTDGNVNKKKAQIMLGSISKKNDFTSIRNIRYV
jgi:hypothetical protein